MTRAGLAVLKHTILQCCPAENFCLRKFVFPGRTFIYLPVGIDNPENNHETTRRKYGLVAAHFNRECEQPRFVVCDKDKPAAKACCSRDSKPFCFLQSIKHRFGTRFRAGMPNPQPGNMTQPMKFTIKTRYKQLLADTVTPVSIYLKLRDKFVNTILLESSDYHGNENSFSYICCQPVAKFEVAGNRITESYPDGSENSVPVKAKTEVLVALENFAQSFRKDETDVFPFIHNGLFGYMAYPAVQYFEDISLKSPNGIPDIVYQVFRYVIAINHFKNEMYVFEHEYNSPPTPEGGVERPPLAEGVGGGDAPFGDWGAVLGAVGAFGRTGFADPKPEFSHLPVQSQRNRKIKPDGRGILGNT